MTSLISLRDVSKSFPGVKALDGVRFDLQPGEVHALMGENGAGKSTLMKILAGVYQKDSGEVLLDGQAIDIQSPAHAQSLAIGIIHQELHLMGHMTAAQNIYLGREPRKLGGWFLDDDQLNRDAQALFSRMNLALAPTAMIFVPCADGISHNEIEDAKPEHLEAGCNVLLQAMLRSAGVVA